MLRARFSLLLGYLADFVFRTHPEAFSKTISFLFESVAYPQNTPEQVIALHSIDTLNTVVCDQDLAARLVPLLPKIVEVITQLTATTKYPSFFEFLTEFVKYYAKTLDAFILNLLQVVITRILTEA